MNIPIYYIIEFLQDFGIKWSGYYSKQSTHSDTLHSYEFKKASEFDDVLNTSLFYFGNKDSDKEVYLYSNNRFSVSDNSQYIKYFNITETKFQILSKEENPEPCGFGDFDYCPYILKLKKDLSLNWIKFLLTKQPEYKNYIISKCAKGKEQINLYLISKQKALKNQIIELKIKFEKEQNYANLKLKEIQNLEELINNLDSQLIK